MRKSQRQSASVSLHPAPHRCNIQMEQATHIIVDAGHLLQQCLDCVLQGTSTPPSCDDDGLQV